MRSFMSRKLLLLMAFLVFPTITRATTIVVNTGTFSSADEAATSEAKANCPIIRIGGKPFPELDPQAYRIQTSTIDNRQVIVLAGAERIGTLYAVYDFLHHLSFRWFAPGEVNEEIPHLDSIPEIDITE